MTCAVLSLQEHLDLHRLLARWSTAQHCIKFIESGEEARRCRPAAKGDQSCLTWLNTLCSVASIDVAS